MNSRALILRDIFYNVVLFAVMTVMICLYGPMPLAGLLSCAVGWIGVDVLKLAFSRD